MKKAFSLLLGTLLVLGFSVVALAEEDVVPEGEVSAQVSPGPDWTYIEFPYAPYSIFIKYHNDDPVDLEIGTSDCCILDDIVEIYVDGCYIGTHDTTTELEEDRTKFHTVSLRLTGDHVIELRHVLSKISASGWYYRLRTLDFTDMPWPCCLEGGMVDIDPNTFNHSRMGNWVTGHIMAPPGYGGEEVVAAEIVMVDGEKCVIPGEIKSPEPIYEIPDDPESPIIGYIAVAKFDSAAVGACLPLPDDGPAGEGKPGRIEDVEICVVAYMANGSSTCMMCDLIDVIDEPPGPKK
jgi:hypothetical protein